MKRKHWVVAGYSSKQCEARGWSTARVTDRTRLGRLMIHDAKSRDEKIDYATTDACTHSQRHDRDDILPQNIFSSSKKAPKATPKRTRSTQGKNQEDHSCNRHAKADINVALPSCA